MALGANRWSPTSSSPSGVRAATCCPKLRLPVTITSTISVQMKSESVHLHLLISSSKYSAVPFWNIALISIYSYLELLWLTQQTHKQTNKHVELLPRHRLQMCCLVYFILPHCHLSFCDFCRSTTPTFHNSAHSSCDRVPGSTHIDLSYGRLDGKIVLGQRPCQLSLLSLRGR